MTRTARLRLLPVLAALLMMATAACGSGNPTLPAEEANNEANNDPGDTGPPVEDTVDEPDVPPRPDVPNPDVTERLGEGQARVGFIEDESALIGGPKADGRLGDLKIYNNHSAFIIETVGRAAAGYRFWGGNVVDADVIRPEGQAGNDLFGELGHSWNLEIFEPRDVYLVDNGTESGTAHVRFTGVNAPFAWADSFIRPLLNPSPVDLEVTYDYMLGAQDTALRHSVTVTNISDEAAMVDFPLLMSNQGDGVRHWQPVKGFEISQGAIDRLVLAGRGPSYEWNAQDVGLSLLIEYSNVEVINQAGFILEPGQSLTRHYTLSVSERGPAGLAALRVDMSQTPATVGTLRGTVELPPSAQAALTHVVVWDGDDKPVSYSPVGADGDFEFVLEPGQWRVQAFATDHAPSAIESVSLEAGAEQDASLTVPAPAQITISVKNSQDQPEPARIVAVVPQDDAQTPAPYAPDAARPDSGGAWRWTGAGNGGKISAVGMAVDGTVTLTVPAGRYDISASRGFAYEIDQTSVEVTEGESLQLDMTINKVVDTTGWLSSDFHIHALRSPDSDTPYVTRIHQAITTNLDIPILTEHVALDGLQRTADAHDLGDRIIGPDGQEVTTFEYGHFNAFPLLYKPGTTNTGGVFPYDKKPAELFEAIRNQNPEDEVIQINHPRGSSLGAYFSYVGYDPATGEVENNEHWSTNWDSIEVFNGRCRGLGDNDVLDDWISMTNNGLLRTLGSGSDSHRENDPIGMPRNWIKIDEQALRQNHQLLVEAVRGRRLFVSCGPFVTFETADGQVGLGGRTGVNEDGQVSFSVEVQAPDWLELDEVRLIRNGQPIDSALIDNNQSGVRLTTTFTDEPQADAWYAIEVVGSGSTLPVHPAGPPYAFTNPIEVDGDGDGQWTPPGLP